MIGLTSLEYMKLAIFYASYLYFPALVILGWIVLQRSALERLMALVALVGLSILAYARFVEPRILLTAEHKIELSGCFEVAGASRIAVFSDTHNGLFGNTMPIGRIVKRINKTNSDFVLIAGDYIYFLHPDHFGKTFNAFADFKRPAFGVLGNHDIGLPGPDLGEPLNETLPAFGVRMIDNQPLKLSNSKFAIELVGLSDQWGKRQNLSLLSAPKKSPRIVLTHNAATMRAYKPEMRIDLLVSGHTHGGQIQLPFLTCGWTGVCGDIAYGLREEKGVQIFTTSGTGMVGLPMRFRVPPRIDVLNISYSACDAE